MSVRRYMILLDYEVINKELIRFQIFKYKIVEVLD